jgi:GT2 family glycosyltransferase
MAGTPEADRASTGRVLSDGTAILIVNFNSGEHLGACLGSIAEHAPEVRVIVVDNASTDGSEGPAANIGDRVSLHRSTTNLGFARAVNQGLTQAHCDAVLLLNPDCRLLPGALAALQTELAAHPDCAVAGPQILDDDGGIQGSVRGDPDMLTGLFGRSTLLTRVFPASRAARRNVRIDVISSETSVSAEVDWISGACMLVRRAALEAVHGFDERYFLYWEDADLCRRLRALGYTIRYVPRAKVMHSIGRSSRSAPALAIRAFHRSAYTYYATHVARTRFARGLAWVLLEGRCRWKLLASRLTRES